MKQIKHSLKLLIILIALDLSMVALHFLFGRASLFFHLDAEQNLPVLYQSTKLVISGLILLGLIFKNQFKTYPKRILVPLSILLVFLGLDEGLQIHEQIEPLLRSINPEIIHDLENFMIGANFSSSVWLLLYLPIFMVAATYAVLAIKTILKVNHSSKLLFVLGIVSLAMVIFFELLGSSGRYFGWHYQTLMILEELSEMFGASFLATFVVAITKPKSRL